MFVLLYCHYIVFVAGCKIKVSCSVFTVVASHMNSFLSPSSCNKFYKNQTPGLIGWETRVQSAQKCMS